jgi:SPP1 family predicted phage head-tail adaptor
MRLVKNAGQYRAKIEIVRETITTDAQGFTKKEPVVILTAHAKVKTTKGFTLIANGSDFEKATTNFTIRYPAYTVITRDDIILFNGKPYEILYLNNVDEAGLELEIQAKEVTH